MTSCWKPGPERISTPKCASAPSGKPLEIAAIASLRPNVDLFFDKVLVNAPDRDDPAKSADVTAQLTDRIFDDRGFFGNRHQERQIMN